MAEPIKICPQCKRHSMLSAAFCICGRQFKTTAPHQPAPADQTMLGYVPPAQPRPSAKPWILALVLCLLAVGLVGTVAVVRFSPLAARLFHARSEQISAPTGPAPTVAPPTFSAPDPPPVSFEKVRLLMTTAQVRSRLGEPDRTQMMQRLGSTDEYWYYGPHQLVFENDHLRAINTY